MKLIVGLGNPGIEYERTRHNVGTLVIEELKRRGVKAHLLEPKSYMNRSGEEVQKAVAYYKLPLTELIVVHDDADLPFGSFKMEAGRGSAGHNGVQSIIDAFGGEKSFTRLRIGISRPTPSEIPLEDWVLGRWSADEVAQLNRVIEESADLIQNELV
ncbi:MAG: aminoacyl-tRNA hydrolase [Patescibacteria group bacterium]